MSDDHHPEEIAHDVEAIRQRRRLRAGAARRVDQARLLHHRDGRRPARQAAADVALHGPLDDVRRRVLVHVPRLRDPRRRAQPRVDRRDHPARLRDLHRLRDVLVIHGRADRPDVRAADAIRLRKHRLGDRLPVRADRAARLGRLPGEPARDALGRLLQLGPHLLADADRRRADDLQQPARLHRDQRVRALPRHAAPDPVGAVHGDQGLHRRRRLVRRHAERQRPPGLGRRRPR